MNQGNSIKPIFQPNKDIQLELLRIKALDISMEHEIDFENAFAVLRKEACQQSIAHLVATKLNIYSIAIPEITISLSGVSISSTYKLSAEQQRLIDECDKQISEMQKKYSI